MTVRLLGHALALGCALDPGCVLDPGCALHPCCGLVTGCVFVSDFNSPCINEMMNVFSYTSWSGYATLIKFCPHSLYRDVISILHNHVF